MTADLYDHPGLYDALLPARAHIPYYVDLATRLKGDVLELACGTGQLTVPIAATGLPTVGLDLSAPMLTAARERSAAAGVPVEYVLGDMRQFDLGRQFRLIFLARNSLLHLHTAEEILATFVAARRHLARGGVFAFDIFNPDVRLLARPAGQRYPLMQAQLESFGTISVDMTNDYDAAAQVNRSTWYVSTPETPDAWVMPVALRSIFPQELPLLLAAGGLRLSSRAGDLSGTPFGPASSLQVCLCEAAS